jgi:hypothetical protein
MQFHSYNKCLLVRPRILLSIVRINVMICTMHTTLNPTATAGGDLMATHHPSQNIYGFVLIFRNILVPACILAMMPWAPPISLVQAVRLITDYVWPQPGPISLIECPSAGPKLVARLQP